MSEIGSDAWRREQAARHSRYRGEDAGFPTPYREETLRQGSPRPYPKGVPQSPPLTDTTTNPQFIRVRKRG